MTRDIRVYAAECDWDDFGEEPTIAARKVPTPEDILHDLSAPFWASNLVRLLMDKDPVDVVNTLEVLTASFQAHLKEIC